MHGKGSASCISKEDTLQTQHHNQRFLQQHNVMRRVVRFGMIPVLGMLFLGVALGVNVLGSHAHAQSLNTCSGGDSAYTVAGGDTLAGIAARYGTTWANLASYNHIANANVIYVNQTICIPGNGNTNSAPVASAAVSVVPMAAVNYSSSSAVGNGNVFPYPACTWWADQRYYQLHGVFVPWTTNANAWQWASDAYQFGWNVSSTPTVGSIIDLQPWVQGAYGGGHVAVVEQVLSNGNVIASSMSWGANPYAVTYWEFSPGPGVTFISQ